MSKVAKVVSPNDDQTNGVYSMPGHLIRRAQQLAVAIFMEETAGFDATPVQFAILHALRDHPGEDQITLSARVAFDPATFGSVIGRLEAKGWVRREPDPGDKRRKLLWTTIEGQAVRLQVFVLLPLPARHYIIKYCRSH